jgi:hypothetical protein
MASRFDRSALIGLKEAKAAFKKAPGYYQEAALEATEKTAFAVMGRARSLVRVETGTLRDFIDWKAPTKSNPFASVGIRKGSASVQRPGKSYTTKETPGSIAHLVEFGFMHTSGKRVAGRPFMIPAAESERGNAQERYAAALRAAEARLESEAK